MALLVEGVVGKVLAQKGHGGNASTGDRTDEQDVLMEFWAEVFFQFAEHGGGPGGGVDATTGGGEDVHQQNGGDGQGQHGNAIVIGKEGDTGHGPKDHDEQDGDVGNHREGARRAQV